MSEHVDEIEIGVRWSPNGAVLCSDDKGSALLRLRPDLDDPDRRGVCLTWSGCRSAEIGDPNDEALSGHRLYELGLAEVVWIGEVRDSELIAKLEQVNRVHPNHDPGRFANLRHFILPLKDCTVEVVSESIEVERRDLD